MNPEIEEQIIKRIKNQLRVHWGWLRKKDDPEEVAKFIECWIKQITWKNESYECYRKGMLALGRLRSRN